MTPALLRRCATTAAGLVLGGTAFTAVAAPASAAPAAAPHPTRSTHTVTVAAAQLPVMQTGAQYAQLLRSLSGTELEKTFMVGMIGRHQMAIMMAQTELGKGSSPAVQAFAQRIIRAQSEEIATMTSSLQHWYGDTVDQARAEAPAQAQSLQQTVDQQMTAEMLQPLQASAAGQATDLAFLQLMIPHHLMAVEEAAAALPVPCTGRWRGWSPPSFAASSTRLHGCRTGSPPQVRCTPKPSTQGTGADPPRNSAGPPHALPGRDQFRVAKTRLPGRRACSRGRGSSGSWDDGPGSSGAGKRYRCG